MSNLLDILENRDAPIDDQQIIEYLKGQLQADVQHTVEAGEQDDELMQEAMDGLRMMDHTKLAQLTGEINRNLNQRITEQKSKRRRGYSWKELDWIILSVVLLLLLLVLGFVVVMKLRH